MLHQPSASRSVTVMPYQNHWPQAFAAEYAALLSALGDAAVALHHIGSTAVPGLAAKPIIDMLLEVTDLAQLDARTDALAQLGYIAKGENGIAGRRYFYKNSPSSAPQRSHHLHAFVCGAPEVRQHLLFRDFLRANPTTAAEYATLKSALAQQFADNPAGYQDGKNAFIAKTLQQALKNISATGD